jgi:hypothetical protein
MCVSKLQHTTILRSGEIGTLLKNSLTFKILQKCNIVAEVLCALIVVLVSARDCGSNTVQHPGTSSTQSIRE